MSTQKCNFTRLQLQTSFHVFEHNVAFFLFLGFSLILFRSSSFNHAKWLNVQCVIALKGDSMPVYSSNMFYFQRMNIQLVFYIYARMSPIINDLAERLKFLIEAKLAIVLN